jgi:hypothetical protein
LRTNKSLENETLPPMQETSTTPVAVPAWNINDITSDPVKSVAELIDWSDRFSPNSARLPTDRPIERWACRGQPRAFGTLKPSLTRNFRLQSIGAAEIIEHRLIEEFRKHYVRVPDLSADMPSPDKIGRHHDLRCLSVMQHYEIPTRLLDWTSNFWTAVYFACASDPGAEQNCGVTTGQYSKLNATAIASSISSWTTPPIPQTSRLFWLDKMMISLSNSIPKSHRA